MYQRTTVSDITGSFASNMIVVDAGDVPELEGVVAALDLTGEVNDRIEPFELVRYAFGDLTRLDDRVPEARAVREAMRQVAGYPEPTDLDVLLKLLRQKFEERGKQLRAGKDRDVELIEGLPHWAGVGRPQPVDRGAPEVAGPITLASRAAQPGRPVRIGVLDTGVYPNPDLDGRYLSSDLERPAAQFPSWAGHATFVIGLIAQQAPGAVIEARRVLDDATGTSSSWALAKAMAGFLGTGVEILHVALGGTTYDDEAPFLLQRAVAKTSKEMLVVAAAGNHGAGSKRVGITVDGGKTEWLPDPRSVSSPMWPAALPEAVAVGAAVLTRCEDGFRMERADFTPPGVDWIRLWAPGVNVESFYIDGDVVETEWTDVKGVPTPEVAFVDKFTGFARWGGTSFACAVAAGRIAVLAQESGGTVEQVYEELRAGQRDGGCGREWVRPSVAGA
jgi:membrane-anchored mycosin MYCP